MSEQKDWLQKRVSEEMNRLTPIVKSLLKICQIRCIEKQRCRKLGKRFIEYKTPTRIGG